MIPLNKPNIKSVSGKYSDYVEFVLSNFQGYNNYILSSAGDGLNSIYKSLYKKRGPLRVGVSPLACFQAIYPIVSNGHIPIFIDIDRDTFNIDIESLVKSPSIDVLEVIHLGGNPNNMDMICEWARNKHILLIEDCAQALGASYKGIPTGNFGDYAVFSLIKNIYSISGGLLLSKETIENAYPIIPQHIAFYKKIKHFLEARCSYKKNNMYNFLYYTLLLIKDRGQRCMNDKCFQLDNKEIEDMVGCINQINYYNKLRVMNAGYMTNLIDNNKYIIQQVIKNGKTNRNRLIFKSTDIPAIEIIRRLRKKGIAANNLTQNYLKEYQPNIKEDAVLSRFCDLSDISCYDCTFPFIFSVPNSSFLSKDEMNYIVKSLNCL